MWNSYEHEGEGEMEGEEDKGGTFVVYWWVGGGDSYRGEGDRVLPPLRNPF